MVTTDSGTLGLLKQFYKDIGRSNLLNREVIMSTEDFKELKYEMDPSTVELDNVKDIDIDIKDNK